jgi:hypothetical protein
VLIEDEFVIRFTSEYDNNITFFQTILIFS